MLAKKQRLTVAAFDEFFKRGRRFHGAYVTLVFTPYETDHGAVVVGKKVFKSAVKRNRLRRQLYPLLRAHFSSKHVSGVYQCLVKPTAKAVAIADIRDDLRAQLARVS